MRKISKDTLDKSLSYAKKYPCLRKVVFNDHECDGRTTLEHALIYGSKQVDEPFAIIPLCAYCHSVDQFQDNGVLDKRKNEFMALSRATEDDFNKYYKSDWRQKLKYYKTIYPHSVPLD